MNIHWTHCIENFFTVQRFWTTCTCPEKQSFLWNFSLYWQYTFYLSGFLSNLRLPWKMYLPWNFSLNWIYFLQLGFLINLPLLWKTELPWNFSLLRNSFYYSGILSNLRLSWKQNFPWNFSSRGAVDSLATRLVRLWAYDIEDENTIFYIVWKMTISK